jgi:glucosylglycerate phosphorylase
MQKEIVQSRILDHLTALYGEDTALETWDRLKHLLETYQDIQAGPSPLDTLQKLDALLITYADQFQVPGQAHFSSLSTFIRKHLKNQISAIHLLPFYPYSSDDGFSVINYKEVNPEMGSWDDLQGLRECSNLMFDAVINHISRESDWFQKYQQNLEPYNKYFIEVDPGLDLSRVTRPRARPLLTAVETAAGQAYVWTTFSPDQIDLNYANPDVLLEILDVLLFYIQQGARIIRLDAIAYLWKEIGTSCIHLPQTHRVIKLMRAVLDLAAPDVILITETNVPHQENISYFGQQLEGINKKYPLGDEAQMVYQFPLAPLILHTFRTGDAAALTSWAASLDLPFRSAAFLNFIASHDGIGVRPAEGLLTTEEIQGLVDQTLANGGQVSYKTNPDGSQSVYELNITLFDMLNEPDFTPLDLGVQRFMASQAIMLSLSGVPGIYINSLFGAPNSHREVRKTGRARSINREKYQVSDLERELADPSSRTFKVFSSYTRYLSIRKEHPAFNPLAPQQVLALGSQVFSVLRIAVDQGDTVLCLINITNGRVDLEVDPALLKSPIWIDLISGGEYQPGKITLEPYQVLWLNKDSVS